jgi:hypothetical protein
LEIEKIKLFLFDKDELKLLRFLEIEEYSKMMIKENLEDMDYMKT